MNIADVELSWPLIAILLAAEGALIVVGLGLIWAIIKVRDQPAPAMLTVTLGLLTLVSILAFVLVKQNVLATLAATGLGALAGSLTNVLSNNESDKKPPKDPDDREESE